MKRFYLPLLLFSMIRLPALAQQPQPEAMREALARMAEIEEEIAGLRGRRQTDEERLFQAQQTLETARSRLEGREREGAATRQFLEQYQQDRGARLGSVAERIQAENLAESQARNAARRAAALLSFEAQRENPSLPSLAALALLENKHREQQRIAAARALRLMGERADVAGELAHAAGTARHYSAFSRYSVEQLREQQQTLAEEIQDLQINFEKEAGEVARLAAQRDDLNRLIGRLSAAGSERPAPVQTPASANTGQAPAVADENAGVPSVNIEIAEEAAAGPRQLFWHATPVAVRAVGAGRVVYAGSFAGYRHLLIIDMGGGWHALYANMTHCALATGAFIGVGDRLGEYQAAQGQRAEPFWFEIRRGTEPAMPAEWPHLASDWKARLFTRTQ